MLLTITNLSFAQNKVTIEVAKQIGSLHNEYVAQGIQNTPQTVSQLKDNFMKIKVDGVDDNIKNQTIEFFTQNDIKKQEEIIRQTATFENQAIPTDMDYGLLRGLSAEEKDKLILQDLYGFFG